MRFIKRGSYVLAHKFLIVCNRMIHIPPAFVRQNASVPVTLNTISTVATQTASFPL